MNTGPVYTYVIDTDTGSWVPLTGSSGADPTPSGLLLNVNAFMLGFDGAAYERVRVANVFRFLFVFEGASQNLWTPALGKRFRLMGISASVCATTAAADSVSLILRDGADPIIWAGQFATNTDIESCVPISLGADFGQGYLSEGGGNALTVTLEDDSDFVDLVTGTACVTVWGTEED